MTVDKQQTQPQDNLERRLLLRLPGGARLDRMDARITLWMARYGLTLMRLALGVVFLWFGALKLAPGLSPAEEMVRDSVFFLNGDWFLPLLALWEMAIGIGLLSGQFMRLTLLLLFLQMPGTLLPIVVRPDLVFTSFPFGLTLIGQYIVKNLALVTAALVIGSTVRGGRIITPSQ